jgi:hypothetical protein
MVRHLLSNEAYIGNSIYNRTSVRLKQARKVNPPELWIRTTGLYEPIVDPSIFLKAQELLKEKQSRLSNEHLLRKLQELLARHGKLSASIIAATDDMPSFALYAYRFGSLREAFRRVGYVNSTKDFDYLEAKGEATAELSNQESMLVTHIRARGISAVLETDTHVMRVAGKLAISVRMARYYAARRHAPVWLLHRRTVEPAELILALRLDKETNREVIDYFLLPLSEMAKHAIALTGTSRSRFEVYRCPTMADVLRAIMEKVAVLLK